MTFHSDILSLHFMPVLLSVLKHVLGEIEEREPGFRNDLFKLIWLVLFWRKMKGRGDLVDGKALEGE